MIIDRNSPIPQYFQLQTWLIEQIEQGIFKPEDKIPTEEELSQITGLARATIRQAIQNLVNMGYLFRKRRLGTFVLKKTQNSTPEKTTIIGVLVPDIRSGYAPELARGAGDEAANDRHSIILCNTDDLFVKADFHADRLIENAVSGVIFIPTAAPDEKNRMIIDKFERNQIPVVLADRLIPDMNLDCVTTDNFEGAYTITQYLIEKGHRRIAVIASSLFSTERERIEGYKKAITDAGLEIDEELIFATDEPFIENRYLQYARNLLNEKKDITAIFAGHDRIAYIIFAVANELHIDIPGKISLVGYDNLNLKNPLPIGLTTMHQPIYEMGVESMKLILSRIRREINTPQQIILKSKLIKRDSVLTHTKEARR